MYRKNFWCKFVIMDDSFTYCLENIERQQCLDKKYEAIHAQTRVQGLSEVYWV